MILNILINSPLISLRRSVKKSSKSFNSRDTPEGRNLKISAAATAQSGSVTTKAKCVSTEGYIVASTQTLPITETVSVGVTNAADKFIKIYNGELVENT